MHPGSTIVEGCNWEGVAPGPAAPVPSPEAVSKLAVKASVRDLRFRNPVCFRAGNIHNFITRWEEVLTGQEKRAEILSYLRDGVDVNSFFAPYKGDFQGKFYDSPIPPSACFPNSKSCEEFTDFMAPRQWFHLRVGKGGRMHTSVSGYAINRRTNETQALS